MGWLKTCVQGLVMNESCEGERKVSLEQKPNMFGAHRVDVDGVVMWENSRGERVKEIPKGE